MFFVLLLFVIGKAMENDALDGDDEEDFDWTLIQSLIVDTHDRMDSAAAQMMADAEAAGIAPEIVERLGSIAWTPPRKRNAQGDAQGSSPGAASSTGSTLGVSPAGQPSGSASSAVAAQTGSAVAQFQPPEEPFWDDIETDSGYVACPQCSKVSAKWKLWKNKKTDRLSAFFHCNTCGYKHYSKRNFDKNGYWRQGYFLDHGNFCVNVFYTHGLFCLGVLH